MQIYVSKNGQQLGPFAESVVIQMLQSGQFSPDDYGFRQGQTQWTPLRQMYPNAVNPTPNGSFFSTPQTQFTPSPQNQFTQPVNAPKKSSTGLILGLLGIGFLFILGIIGVVGLIYLNRPNSSRDNSVGLKTTPSPSIPTPTPKPSYNFLQGKATEFAKLKPPIKLESKAILKGKTLILEQSDKASEYSAEIKGFKYSSFEQPDESDLSLYGLTKDKLPTKLEELDTLVQIVCGKGREVGKFGPITAYVPAYANTCKVSIINYRESTIVFQKIIENGKRPAKIYVRDGENEHILPMPTEAIQKYVKSLPSE